MLLYPFSILYKAITSIRNYLYNSGTKAVYLPPVTTIIVGNLSTGGTGKTPHTAWLVQQLHRHYQVATLSRGYKRKTRGFLIAGKQSTAEQIGDEPAEYVQRFPDVTVTVGEDRVQAVKQIITQLPQTDIILLDDAFQHRAIDAHIKVLLTTYDAPFYNDHVLPQGRLREAKEGYKRADYIIVTKCPEVLNETEQAAIIRNISPCSHQQVLFSSYVYHPPVHITTGTPLPESDKTLVAISGLANPSPLLRHLRSKGQTVIEKSFKDHFEYTDKIITTLLSTYPDDRYQILLTRKDAVKWLMHPELLTGRNIGVVDIDVVFHGSTDTFIQHIKQQIRYNNEQRTAK